MSKSVFLRDILVLLDNEFKQCVVSHNNVSGVIYQHSPALDIHIKTGRNLGLIGLTIEISTSHDSV